MSDADRARTLRRRHMHERQAVVFGILLAALAVIGLGAAAVYTGSVTFPFVEQDFQAEPTASPKPVAAFPCPPEGEIPEPYDAITVNVYNTTATAGLASSTMQSLTQRGFLEGKTANQPEYEGTAQVVFGQASIGRAYVLAAQVPDAQLVLDGRKGGSVDLILGAEFTALTPADEVDLDPDAPIPAPKGCTPYDDLLAATATATPTTAPATPEG